MTRKATVLQHPSARFEAAAPSLYHERPPTSQAPDAEVAAAGEVLRDYARHLADNSAIVSAILDARVASGVGAGLTYEPMIRARPSAKQRANGEPGDLLTELNDAVRRIVVEEWAQAVDTSGETSRAELERTAWRAWDCDGEVFGRRVVRGRTPERLGYQVQLIESDLVPYGTWHNNRAVLGIERDDYGAPVLYRVWPYRPSLWRSGYGMQQMEAKDVPALDVRHLRRAARPGQTRGITLLHAVLFRISDIAEYQQSHRLAARAAEDLFAMVKKDPAMLGRQLAEAEDDERVDAQDRDWQFDRLQVLEGRPGESVDMFSPQHPNQNAVDFVREELRAIAAACRIGFSQIAQVFDRAYAAQRLELVYAWRMVEQDRAQFVSDFARPLLYRWPLEIARLEGRLPARALRRADPRTLYDVRIDGPTMPVIDPEKDRKAFVLDQEQGWDSRHSIIRKLGRVPAQVDAERAADTQAPAPTVKESLSVEPPPADDEEDVNK